MKESNEAIKKYQGYAVDHYESKSKEKKIMLVQSGFCKNYSHMGRFELIKI